MMTTLLTTPQCMACQHFRSPLDGPVSTDRPSCAAFPAAIPAEIWENRADHRQAYADDNGIRWAGERFPEYVLSERGADPHGERKFDPLQPRDKYGQWTDGLPGAAVVDKLKLASRIELAPDQRLVSSSRVRSRSGNSAVFALIEGLAGPELRVGVVDENDERNWRAGDRGRTVKLDAAGMEQLRTNSQAMAGRAQELRAEHGATMAAMDKQGLWDGPATTDEQTALVAKADALMDGGVRDSGVLASGPWGDLVFDIITDDVEDDPVTVRVDVRPPGAGTDWSVNRDATALDFNDTGVTKFADGVTAATTLPSARVAVRPHVRALVRALLREFSEAKVKRDRKGRFAKQAAGPKPLAAEVLTEMDDLLARLDALMKSSGTDDDEASNVDSAMDFLKMARRDRERRGDDDDEEFESYFNLDTQQYHSLEIEADTSDGTVSISHDDGGIWLSAADAEEVAGFIDDFDDYPIPNGANTSEIVASKTTSSGEWEVALYGSGKIEVGITGSIDESDDHLHIDPFDPDDAKNIADALEETAAAALKGASQ